MGGLDDVGGSYSSPEQYAADIVNLLVMPFAPTVDIVLFVLNMVAAYVMNENM